MSILSVRLIGVMKAYQYKIQAFNFPGDSFNLDLMLTPYTRVNLIKFESNWICQFFFLLPERELITPPLEDGLILRSITRKSILELMAEWKEYKCTERRITMSELISLNEQKKVSMNIIKGKYRIRNFGSRNIA